MLVKPFCAHRCVEASCCQGALAAAFLPWVIWSVKGEYAVLTVSLFSKFKLVISSDLGAVSGMRRGCSGKCECWMKCGHLGPSTGLFKISIMSENLAVLFSEGLRGQEEQNFHHK